MSLGEFGRHTPLLTIAGALELNRVFSYGVNALKKSDLQPLEKGLIFFLFGAFQQFSFDGKRTSRFMMNGVLMSSGIDAISVPAAQAQSFNANMVRFLLDGPLSPVHISHVRGPTITNTGSVF